MLELNKIHLGNCFDLLLIALNSDNPFYKSLQNISNIDNGCLLINDNQPKRLSLKIKIDNRRIVPISYNFLGRGFLFISEKNLAYWCHSFLMTYLGFDRNDFWVHGQRPYRVVDFVGYPDLRINKKGICHDRLYIEFKTDQGTLRETQKVVIDRLRKDPKNDVHIVRSINHFLAVISKYFTGHENTIEYPYLVERLYVDNFLSKKSCLYMDNYDNIICAFRDGMNFSYHYLDNVKIKPMPKFTQPQNDATTNELDAKQGEMF
jgi:hypothetical protein